MPKVTGIGGIFFKARNAEALRAWYQQHLGIETLPWGGSIFPWQEAEPPHRPAVTVWNIMPDTTTYLEPSKSSFMLNLRVSDLKAALAELRAQGVTVDDKVEESEFGKFGWIMDPEGNRIELWEPPAKMPG